MVLVILKHTVFQSYMWRIIFTRRQNFHLTDGGSEKFQIQEGRIVMSCKPILDHERVIWLETFFYSTTLHANSIVRGLEGGGD